MGSRGSKWIIPIRTRSSVRGTGSWPSASVSSRRARRTATARDTTSAWGRRPPRRIWSTSSTGGPARRLGPCRARSTSCSWTSAATCTTTASTRRRGGVRSAKRVGGSPTRTSMRRTRGAGRHRTVRSAVASPTGASDRTPAPARSSPSRPAVGTIRRRPRPPTPCRPPSSSRSPMPPLPIFAGCARSSRTWREGEAMARILIVGGGYIGLYAARHLERRLPAGTHELVMVSPENHMTYQPFLPEVASGLIDPRAVVVPLRRALRRTRLILGEVERIDVEDRVARIRLPDGRPRDEPFDVGVIGAGSWSRTLPIPGLAEHAVGFKTLPEAIWLRNRVLAQLDTASEAEDADERRTALGFVFVGAGFAGIEAIGELEDFARAALATYPPGMGNDMRRGMVEATDT